MPVTLIMLRRFIYPCCILVFVLFFNGVTSVCVYFYHEHYVFVPLLVIEREAAGLVRVSFILRFIDFIILVAFHFPPNCLIVCSGGWRCGGFGGVSILYGLVQISFRRLLGFCIVFVYIFSWKELPAYIISCADFLALGRLYWVSTHCVHQFDSLGDGGNIIDIVVLCYGGVFG